MENKKIQKFLELRDIPAQEAALLAQSVYESDIPSVSAPVRVNKNGNERPKSVPPPRHGETIGTAPIVSPKLNRLSGTDSSVEMEKNVKSPVPIISGKRAINNDGQDTTPRKEPLGSQEQNAIKFSSPGSTSKKRKNVHLPAPGEPGSLNDPFRKGLCGARVKWYLRYLKAGLAPQEARNKAVNNRPDLRSSEKCQSELLNITPIPPVDSTRKKTLLLAESSSSDISIHQNKERKAENGEQSTEFTSSEDVKREASEYEKVYSFAIMPIKFPEDTLDPEQLDLLQEALIKEIAKGWAYKLRFRGVQNKEGYLILDCKDRNTADWLIQIAPKLEHWTGPLLYACDAKEVNFMKNVMLWLPKSAGKKVSLMLALIQAQNEGVNTSLWKVHVSKSEGSKMLLQVGIDEQSYEAIKQNSGKLEFRFGNIPAYFPNKHSIATTNEEINK